MIIKKEMLTVTNLILIFMLFSMVKSVCDPDTCEYCCVDSVEGLVCKNDIYLCKLKKHDDLEKDILILTMLIVILLFGITIVQFVLQFMMFKVVYKGRTLVGIFLLILMNSQILKT